MGDWLKVFGKYQPNLPAGLGVDNYYIPTNDKSLVVSYSISIPLVLHHFNCGFDYRYPFSQPELSLVLFVPSQWETRSAVNGELSRPVSSSVLGLVSNLIPSGQLSS